MATAFAAVCHPDKTGNALQIERITLPELGSDEVLVRVQAVAQNPTDIKGFDYNRFGDGAVLGCDFAGTIEEVGTEVHQFKPGDIVAGLVRGGFTQGVGAYSTRTITKARFCFKLTENITLEAAATIPLALTTAWLALFSPFSLNIDRRSAKGLQLLIWGGSTSVGQYAIQVARHYGIQVVTTCRNKAAVERLGVKHVFDHTSPRVLQDISAEFPNVTHVLDCVGMESSSAQASQVIVRPGGSLCTVQPGKRFTENVRPGIEVTDVLVFTAFYEDIGAGTFVIKKRESDRDLANELYENLSTLIADGSILPNETHLLAEGLEAVSKGFQLYRENKVSGQKIVYRL